MDKTYICEYNRNDDLLISKDLEHIFVINLILRKHIIFCDLSKTFDRV